MKSRTELEEEVNKNKISLIKVVYSDINSYEENEFGVISRDMAISILKQLKDFRENFKYNYPKFILHSNVEQFKNCFELLLAGCTLSEVEEYYFDYLVSKKVKVL